MTVSYAYTVSTAGLLTFHRLLFYWKGSVWKNIWKELIGWCLGYLSLTFLYRFVLRDTDQGRTFEEVVHYCNSHLSAFPITFLLGFYVTLVAQRWWNIFKTIPWSDNLSISIATFLEKSDDEKVQEKEQLIRLTIARYLMLANVLVMRDISAKVKSRFPFINNLILGKLMTEEEAAKIEHLGLEETVCKYWVPLMWIMTLLRKSYDKGRMKELQFLHAIQHLLAYRAKLGELLSYDWVSIPLAYTQMIDIAVYSYFIICIVARQYIDPSRYPNSIYSMDIYVPFYTLMEFVFYVGWFKVAQVMINPFGLDDDDFEVFFLIDRNFQVSKYILDNNFADLPKLNDFFVEGSLGHTIASAQNACKDHPMIGSVAKMNVSATHARIIDQLPIHESKSFEWLDVPEPPLADAIPKPSVPPSVVVDMTEEHPHPTRTTIT